MVYLHLFNKCMSDKMHNNWVCNIFVVSVKIDKISSFCIIVVFLSLY